MRIANRLFAAFAAAALVPLLLFAFGSTEVARDALEGLIDSHLSERAREKALDIERILAERLEEARRLAAQPALVTAARTAPHQSLETILRHDAQWIDAERHTPLADRIVTNALSRQLITYQQRGGERYGELFITDARGAALAMTKRLSDYYQADEEWWSGAFADGAGGVFYDDRGFDATVQAVVIGVVVPIWDHASEQAADRERTVIGILKINFRSQEIVEVVSRGMDGQPGEVILRRGDGSEIARASSRVSDDTPSPRALITATAPITTPIRARIPSPEARKGISGERWAPAHWSITVELERELAFAPVQGLVRLSLAVAALSAVLVVLATWLTARGISRPVERLRQGTERIGAGEWSHRVATVARDEIGELSRAFDTMTERLTQISASREELAHEVQARASAQRALEEAGERLRRSNDELQQFAYVVSHDLQEPLRMVSSYLQLIERRYQGRLDEDADEFIAFAVDGANRMSAMIEGLLQFSRVRSEGHPFERVAMEQVLAEALANLRLALEESGGEVSHDPLPELEGDRAQLTRLLQNLIGNALKFRGETPPRVHIEARRVDDRTHPPMWRLAVRDNGIGIEAKYAERIFTMFQRLHTREQFPGMGIGLAVCKRIVERHGGTIGVDSRPGEGTTIHFTLAERQSGNGGGDGNGGGNGGERECADAPDH